MGSQKLDFRHCECVRSGSSDFGWSQPARVDSVPATSSFQWQGVVGLSYDTLSNGVQYERDMATEVFLGAGRAPLLLIFGWTVCLVPPGASSCETALRRSFGSYPVRTVVAVCVVASSREMAASLTPASLSPLLFLWTFLPPPRLVSFAHSRRHASGELPEGSSHGCLCLGCAPPSVQFVHTHD